MKIVRNLILSFIFVLIAMYVYFNYEKIYVFMRNFITPKNEIILPSINEYKREYEYLNFSKDEDFMPQNKIDILNIFYNILNNGWNEFTFYCPIDYEKCIDDISEISNDKDLMNSLNGYVNPFNSFSSINIAISSNREIFITVNKKYNKNEIKIVNDKIDEIVYKLNFYKINENEEKIKLFHNYLIDNVSYDEEFANNKISNYSPNKAIGALIYGKAVCSGYSDTLAILFDRLNIPNIIISNNEHAWNLIYLNDKWLHIDSTWNDAEITNFEFPFYLIDTAKLKEINSDNHMFNNDFFKEAN